MINWPPKGCFEISRPYDWHSDDEKKRAFGVALSKFAVPFEAACQVFQSDTAAALWASLNWLNDPVVLAAKDLYAKELIVPTKLLDKEQLAAKVLAFYDEKDPSGKFFAVESKERLAALALYAKICGYVDKIDINNSTNFTNNSMKITLVKANNENKPQTIEASANDDQIIDNPLPMRIKLVR